MEPIRVSCSVTSDDPNIVARAVDALGKAASGLAMEGVEVFLFIRPDDDEDGV